MDIGPGEVEAHSFTVALINDSLVFPAAVDSPPNPATMKKVRQKTASPTRHGPQQCQVCWKLIATIPNHPDRNTERDLREGWQRRATELDE